MFEKRFECEAQEDTVPSLDCDLNKLTSELLHLNVHELQSTAAVWGVVACCCSAFRWRADLPTLPRTKEGFGWVRVMSRGQWPTAGKAALQYLL